MRKTIGVLLMVAVVGGFVWMMKDKLPVAEKAEVATNQNPKKVDATKEIDRIAKQIEKDYPSDAEAVVELHNELMGICYRYSMDEKDVKNYAHTIRQLYSNKFKELNPEETQIEALNKERETMGTEQMELITSKITEIYVAQDDQGEEMSAEINVAHATNLGGTVRTYLLIKEDGLWKINGWETMEGN